MSASFNFFKGETLMADLNSREVVIKMRDALKAGRNLPLRVYADNTFIIVDESSEAAFTKWLDDVGILIYFRLQNIFDAKGVGAAYSQCISVGAIKYEFIQTMEVAPMPLVHLDEIFDSIDSVTTDNKLKPEFKEQIKYVYNKYLSKDNIPMGPKYRNAYLGAKVLPEGDDYYNGYMYEARKETGSLNDRNAELRQYLEDQKNKNTTP